MKEKEFQGWVLDVAARLGWRAWHVPMPVRPVGGGNFVPETRAKGLPDLILLHDDPPRLIFAEVKGSMGRLSPEQREFLELADYVASSVDDLGGRSKRVLGAYSWRPGQERMIEAILRGKVLA